MFQLNQKVNRERERLYLVDHSFEKSLKLMFLWGLVFGHFVLGAKLSPGLEVGIGWKRFGRERCCLHVIAGQVCVLKHHQLRLVIRVVDRLDLFNQGWQFGRQLDTVQSFQYTVQMGELGPSKEQ